MTQVYIELFLLDNMLMGYLILLCAEPFARARLNKPLAAAVCGLEAVYAAFAMNVPAMTLLPFQLVLLSIMVIPFLPKTIKQAARCGGCVLLSTWIMGGASYMVFEQVGPLPFRALLALSALSSFLVRPIKRLVAKVRLSGRDVKIRITAPGIERTVSGRLDTGNTLREPVTGLPVIVLYSDAAPKEGGYCVAYHTVGGGGVMQAVRGKARLVEGGEDVGERDCCVAFSPEPIADCDAVVNAELFAV